MTSRQPLVSIDSWQTIIYLAGINPVDLRRTFHASFQLLGLPYLREALRAGVVLQNDNDDVDDDDDDDDADNGEGFPKHVLYSSVSMLIVVNMDPDACKVSGNSLKYLKCIKKKVSLLLILISHNSYYASLNLIIIKKSSRPKT